MNSPPNYPGCPQTPPPDPPDPVPDEPQQPAEPSPPPTPDQPTGTAGDRSVTLDWPSVSGATSYEVQQRDGGVNAGWDTLAPATDSIVFNGSSAVISGLVNGDSYSHRVRSVNGSKVSGWSVKRDTSLPPMEGRLTGNTNIPLDGRETISAWVTPDYVQARLFFTGANITTAKTCPPRASRSTDPPTSVFYFAFSIAFTGCVPGTSTVILRTSYGELLRTLTITVLEPAPEDFAVRVDGMTANLSWSHDGYAKDYQVEILHASEADPSTEDLKVSAGHSPTSTSGRLNCGDTSFRVRARRHNPPGAWGSWSSTETVTRDCDPPPAPTGLNARPTSESTIDLTWTLDSSFAEYKAQLRKLVSGSWTQWTEWTNSVALAGGGRRLVALNCATSYEIQIAARGDNMTYDREWSAWSATASPSATPACATPGMVTDSFQLYIGGASVGTARFKHKWTPQEYYTGGVRFNTFTLHELQADFAKAYEYRASFTSGFSKTEFYRNGNLWFTQYYSPGWRKIDNPDFSSNTGVESATWAASYNPVAGVGTSEDLGSLLDRVTAKAIVLIELCTIVENQPGYAPVVPICIPHTSPHEFELWSP